jgi:hypothetical protein
LAESEIAEGVGRVRPKPLPKREDVEDPGQGAGAGVAFEGVG